MIDYQKVNKHQDNIKALKEKLQHEGNLRKKELIKYKIAILEVKIKIERLKV